MNWTENDWPKGSAPIAAGQTRIQSCGFAGATVCTQDGMTTWPLKCYYLQSTDADLLLWQSKPINQVIMSQPLGMTEGISFSPIQCWTVASASFRVPNFFPVGGTWNRDDELTGWELWSTGARRHIHSDRTEFLNSMCTQLSERNAVLSQLLTKCASKHGWPDKEVQEIITACQFIHPFG